MVLKDKQDENMAEISEKDVPSVAEEVEIVEQESDPPPAGPSNVLQVRSAKGKAIVVKREGEATVEYEYDVEK